ncbi:MAG: hypothetical protein AB4042_21535 [Leptolyngbyaceae cyanobacterium]
MNFRPRLSTKVATALGLITAIATTFSLPVAQAQNLGPQRCQAIAQNRLEEVYTKGRGPRGDRQNRPRGPRFCENGGNGERLEQMDAFLSANLELSETQQENWAAVLETFDSLDVESACASDDRETLRAVGRQMREPLHIFRDSLSDEQKDELREFMQEQRERRRAEFDAANEEELSD